MLAGRADFRVLTNLQQEIEFFREERIVVFEVEAEEWIGFDERAAADNDLCSTLRKQVERRELLKDANRISRAEHGYSTGQTDPASACSRRGQDDRRRGVGEIVPVVFADAKNIHPDTVGELDLLQKIVQALRGTKANPGHRVSSRGDEAVDADLHGNDS